jgi:hypothetical protein
MAYKGYDLFFTAPGQVGEMICKVCRTTCTVHRDRYGPTGFAAAMGKISDSAFSVPRWCLNLSCLNISTFREFSKRGSSVFCFLNA